MEELWQKRKAALEIRRHKIIHTLVEWRKKEAVRKKERAARLAHEQEQKQEAMEQKWEIRQEFQRNWIKKEQFLLECIDNQRTEFIQQYNEKLQKESERMQRLLEKVKIFLKCYMARRLPGSKERICCEKYMDGDAEAEGASKQKSTTDTNLAVAKQKKDKVNKTEIKQTKKPSRHGKPVTEGKIIDKKMSKRRKKKRKKGAKGKSDMESEKKDSQLDLQEAESALKTKTPESSQSEETVKDKCRCQLIEAIKRTPVT